MTTHATLAETIAALEARVAEAKEWVARQVAWETAYRLTQEAKDRAEKAEADNARLRALVKEAEYAKTVATWQYGETETTATCPWCDSPGVPHAPDCRAFTLEGVVR